MFTGSERVLRPVVMEDHRIEWMSHWQPAPEPRPRKLNRSVDIPQPTFVLPEPLKLATRGERPLYQGLLQLLAGPHRIEGGWWDRTTVDGEERTRKFVRDYWVALSEHAGVLWVFQTRLANDPTAWFLHGIFGLHLLAIMYTAFRQIDPTMDTGADFSAKYQAAMEMQKP